MADLKMFKGNLGTRVYDPLKIHKIHFHFGKTSANSYHPTRSDLR